MKRAILVGALAFMVLLTGCGPSSSKKATLYPDMYVEHPKSILILPPINKTTAATAKEYYPVTLAEPLTNHGYYVYSMEAVSDVLKMEGSYDTELMENVPLEKFKETFGADAVMYTRITKWDTDYAVISGFVTVSVKIEIKSTTTGKTLWSRTAFAALDTSGGNSGGGIAGLVVKLIATAINTAVTDYVPVARMANWRAMVALPHGVYNSKFNKDNNDEILVEMEKKEEEKAGSTEGKDSKESSSP